MVIPNILAAHFLELFVSSDILLWSCVFIALLLALTAPRTTVLPSKSRTQTFPNSYHFRWLFELFQLNQLFEFIWLPLQFLTYLTDSEYQCPPSFASFPILFIFNILLLQPFFYQFLQFLCPLSFHPIYLASLRNPTIDQSCWASLRKCSRAECCHGVFMSASSIGHKTLPRNLLSFHQLSCSPWWGFHTFSLSSILQLPHTTQYSRQMASTPTS